MRTFVNLFLLAYLVDALLSVADELLKHFLDLTFLAGVRYVFAMAVLAWALVLYAALAFDSRIPKRVVLPLVGYLFIVSFFSFLLYQVFSETSVNITIALGQLTLVLSVLTGFGKRFGGPWHLPEAAFTGHAFTWRNLGRFALINFGIAIPALPLLIYFITVESVRLASAEFIRVDYAGVYLTEKRYRSDNNLIRLIPMIHIGEQSFYTEISETLSSDRAVILTEGVSDDDNLMGGFRGAQDAAQILGLQSQTDMLVDGEHIDLDAMETVTDSAPGSSAPKIVHADIDSSSLLPETREYLNHIGSLVKRYDSMWESMRAIYAWADANVTADEQKRIYEDILDKRNVVLLSHLDKSLTLFNEVLIPWGAMHMPALEDTILKRGFRLTSEQERSAVRFWD